MSILNLVYFVYEFITRNKHGLISYSMKTVNIIPSTVNLPVNRRETRFGDKGTLYMQSQPLFRNLVHPQTAKSSLGPRSDKEIIYILATGPVEPPFHILQISPLLYARVISELLSTTPESKDRQRIGYNYCLNF